jgi:hypothetical protein
LRDGRAQATAIVAQVAAVQDLVPRAEEEWLRNQRANIGKNGKKNIVPWPKKHRDALIASLPPVKGSLFAFDLLPTFNKCRASVFDIMHCLHLGVIKKHFKEILIEGFYPLYGGQPDEVEDTTFTSTVAEPSKHPSQNNLQSSVQSNGSKRQPSGKKTRSADSEENELEKQKKRESPPKSRTACWS